MQDGYGWQRHECESCKAVNWVENTRIPGHGETFSDELFRKHYAVDDKKRSIKPKTKYAKDRDTQRDEDGNAWMEEFKKWGLAK